MKGWKELGPEGLESLLLGRARPKTAFGQQCTADDTKPLA
jgi:hypothetical protein